MNYIVIERYFDEKNKFTAGTKARDDMNSILTEAGLEPIIVEAPNEKRIEATFIKKILLHKEVTACWEKSLARVEAGDTVIFQFPFWHHSLFLKSVIKKTKKRGVKFVAYIHDLEYLRLSRTKDLSFMQRWRIKNEELSVMGLFDKIVVHNERMKNYIIDKLDIQENKLIDLEIFDYLMSFETTKSLKKKTRQETNYPCIIAGNLDRRKAGYAYDLPNEPIFNLYGVNYTSEKKGNINYCGAFPPDELPLIMEGSFGIVWDGDRADTCRGIWGEYLKYNNPHKTSLYLACGLPVIIWDKAALADFVTQNKVGVTVGSLNDLKNVLKNISQEEYINFQKNAGEVAEKMHRGYYTRRALEKALL